MEMHQVRYFLSLCAELNFTRAAERCNVAQPSLTRAIKQLEEELGGALFHRERANTHCPSSAAPSSRIWSRSIAAPRTPSARRRNSSGCRRRRCGSG